MNADVVIEVSEQVPFVLDARLDREPRLRQEQLRFVAVGVVVVIVVVVGLFEAEDALAEEGVRRVGVGGEEVHGNLGERGDVVEDEVGVPVRRDRRWLGARPLLLFAVLAEGVGVRVGLADERRHRRQRRIGQQVPPVVQANHQLASLAEPPPTSPRRRRRLERRRVRPVRVAEYETDAAAQRRPGRLRRRRWRCGGVVVVVLEDVDRDVLEPPFGGWWPRVFAVDWTSPRFFLGLRRWRGRRAVVGHFVDVDDLVDLVVAEDPDARVEGRERARSARLCRHDADFLDLFVARRLVRDGLDHGLVPSSCFLAKRFDHEGRSLVVFFWSNLLNVDEPLSLRRGRGRVRRGLVGAECGELGLGRAQAGPQQLDVAVDASVAVAVLGRVAEGAQAAVLAEARVRAVAHCRGALH
mmetsp:Transcript_7252/g.22325  ORF Transcript_7252/g.22325 Transcript_7252/m.22325 type:complete len:411 (+) Transcript_7252:153-1385(+)